MNNLVTNPATLSSTLDVQLGTTQYDTAGNLYIFLKGVASTAKYDFVTYDNAYQTTRAVTGGKGAGAVAQSACTGTGTSTYGWYMIQGSSTVNSTGATSGGAVYLHATAGNISSTTNANNSVTGALSRSATSSGTSTLQFSFPFVNGVL